MQSRPARVNRRSPAAFRMALPLNRFIEDAFTPDDGT